MDEPMRNAAPPKKTPSAIIQRKLHRSPILPNNGEQKLCTSIPIEYAPAVSARVQPNSPAIGLKKNPIELRIPTMADMTIKTTASTTQPYHREVSLHELSGPDRIIYFYLQLIFDTRQSFCRFFLSFDVTLSQNCNPVGLR